MIQLFVEFFKVRMPSHYHTNTIIYMCSCTRAYVERRKPYYGQTVVVITWPALMLSPLSGLIMWDVLLYVLVIIGKIAQICVTFVGDKVVGDDYIHGRLPTPLHPAIALRPRHLAALNIMTCYHSDIAHWNPRRQQELQKSL